MLAWPQTLLHSWPSVCPSHWHCGQRAGWSSSLAPPCPVASKSRSGGQKLSMILHGMMVRMLIDVFNHSGASDTFGWREIVHDFAWEWWSGCSVDVINQISLFDSLLRMRFKKKCMQKLIVHDIVQHLIATVCFSLVKRERGVGLWLRHMQTLHDTDVQLRSQTQTLDSACRQTQTSDPAGRQTQTSDYCL